MIRSNPFRLLVPLAALLAGTASAAPAAEPAVVRGTVVAIDPKAGTLTVRPTAGADVPLTAGAGARVEVDGRPVKLDQIKKGQRVRATYAAANGKNEVVLLKPAVVTDEQLGREVKRALAAAKSYTFAQKDRYAADLRAAADDVDDRIDRLEAEARDAGAEAKARLQARIDQLRKQRGALNDRRSKVLGATADAWDDVKAGAEAALSDLDRALDALFKK